MTEKSKLAGLTVLLVGNYLPDGQESMQRYAQALQRGLLNRGVNVILVRPEPCVGTLFKSGEISKWLGYWDKFILFPFRLRHLLVRQESSGAPIIVHVCDHSNACYINIFKKRPNMVTCHDMLAIRQAISAIPGRKTRLTGRVLQRLNSRGLERAHAVVCVSEQTRNELLAHTQQSPARVYRIYNGLNHPYQPMPHDLARELAGMAFARGGKVMPEKFLLHVGGDAWYKNRDGLVSIYERLCELRTDAPPLVLLGKAPVADLAKQIAGSNCADQIFCITDANNEELNACYSLAEVFVFPSLAEGYGWPIAEAMACGCRVITTNRDPMREVGGAVAAYACPEDIDSFAKAVGKLLDETGEARAERVKRGLARAVEFRTETMVDAYLERYRRVAANGESQIKTEV